MLEKYLEMMEQLKALGEEILESEETEGCEPWFDELDCMDSHLEIGLRLLKKAIAE